MRGKGKGWQRKGVICKSEEFPIPLKVFYFLTFTLSNNLPYFKHLITHFVIQTQNHQYCGLLLVLELSHDLNILRNFLFSNVGVTYFKSRHKMNLLNPSKLHYILSNLQIETVHVKCVWLQMRVKRAQLGNNTRTQGGVPWLPVLTYLEFAQRTKWTRQAQHQLSLPYSTLAR